MANYHTVEPIGIPDVRVEAAMVGGEWVSVREGAIG